MNLKSLESYLPKGALAFIESWLANESIRIIIKPARKTKLGDYKYLVREARHQITVDGSLAPYEFFFVFSHEIAHLFVYKQFKGGVLSHGDEWKLTFGKMLLESIEVYPDELKPFIYRHALNPRASVHADRALYRKLFMKENELEKMVENLGYGQKFRLGKRIFERGAKRKIRYICREVKTNKAYLVNGQAIVDEIISE